MPYVYTSIVGMRFRNLASSFRSSINFSGIKLLREPSNSYDKFAVKCIYSDVHFGYIRRTESEEVFKHLLKSRGYRIKLLESGENFYKISITFESSTTKSTTTANSRPKTTSKVQTSRAGTSTGKQNTPSRPVNRQRPKYTEINKPNKKNSSYNKKQDDSSGNSLWLALLILVLLYFFLVGSSSEKVERLDSTPPVTQAQIDEPIIEDGPTQTNSDERGASLNARLSELIQNQRGGESPPAEIVTPAVPFLGLPANAQLINGGASWECIPGFIRLENRCERQ